MKTRFNVTFELRLVLEMLVLAKVSGGNIRTKITKSAWGCCFSLSARQIQTQHQRREVLSMPRAQQGHRLRIEGVQVQPRIPPIAQRPQINAVHP